MNVRLESQTLSASVADALRYAYTNGYNNCDATVNLIYVMGHLFDIFNGHSPVAEGHKSPVRPKKMHFT